jgi:hypothetical protein
MDYFFTIWGLFGIIVLSIAAYFDYRNGYDFKIKEIPLFFIAAILGPIILFGVFDSNTILIKGKKPKNET